MSARGRHCSDRRAQAPAAERTGATPTRRTRAASERGTAAEAVALTTMAKRSESQRYQTRFDGLPDDVLPAKSDVLRARDGEAEHERQAYDRRLDFRPVARVFPLKGRPSR